MNTRDWPDESDPAYRDGVGHFMQAAEQLAREGYPVLDLSGEYELWIQVGAQ